MILYFFLSQMDEMIAEIREVFISNLNDLPWMDAETKKEAALKVRVHVPAPYFWSLSSCIIF